MIYYIVGGRVLGESKTFFQGVLRVFENNCDKFFYPMSLSLNNS